MEKLTEESKKLIEEGVDTAMAQGVVLGTTRIKSLILAFCKKPGVSFEVNGQECITVSNLMSFLEVFVSRIEEEFNKGITK